MGESGLTAQMVTRVLAMNGRVVLLATMRSQEHAQYSPRRESRAQEPGRELVRGGRDVLRLAHEIRLERRWTQPELSRAREFSADPRIAEALEHAARFGVAEYIAAAPQLVAEWRDAWSPGEHPRGAALVAAAVDVHRAGFHSPVSRPLLVRLHEEYLGRRGGDALRPEPIDEAFRWATEPLHATSSLLLPVGEDRYVAFDYLPDIVDADRIGAPVPDSVWEALIAEAAPAGVFDVGQAAYNRQRFGSAERAFRKAVAAGNPSAALWVAESLGAGGNPLGAVRFLHEVTADRERVLGADHVNTLASRHELAYWIGAAGDVAAAADVARAVRTDRERVLGVEHPDTLHSRHRHAALLSLAGDPDTALHITSRLIDDFARILGPDHTDTLRIRKDNAAEVGYAGDPEMAVVLLQAVSADRLRVHGPDHPETLWSRYHIAYWTGEAGDPAAAVHLFESVSLIVRVSSAPTIPELSSAAASLPNGKERSIRVPTRHTFGSNELRLRWRIRQLDTERRRIEPSAVKDPSEIR